MPVQPVVATEVKDRSKGWYPKVQVERGRKTGVKWFRVNTDDHEAVLTAVALPQVGDTYSGEHDDLYVSVIDPVYIGGRDWSATSWGWHIVRVEYATLDQVSPELLVTDGDSFSEWAEQSERVAVNADTAGAPFPPNVQFNKEVLSDVITVKTFQQSVSHGPWFAIRGKVNADTVSFPEIFGAPGTNFVASAGTLLARARSIRPLGRDSLLEVAYSFGYADDWKVRYRETDENDNPVGDIIEAEIYETASYNAESLW